MTAQNLHELLQGKPLNEREIAVLTGVALGETAADTGARLFLAAETIKENRKKIVAKLGAKNLYNAVAVGIGIGYIDITKIIDE